MIPGKGFFILRIALQRRHLKFLAEGLPVLAVENVQIRLDTTSYDSTRLSTKSDDRSWHILGRIVFHPTHFYVNRLERHYPTVQSNDNNISHLITSHNVSFINSKKYRSLGAFTTLRVRFATKRPFAKPAVWRPQAAILSIPKFENWQNGRLACERNAP